MRKFFFLIFTVGSLISCAPENGVEVVNIQGKYSLSIPSFLTKVNNLNEDASLQYQHAWKELYVIVIDETKTEYESALDIYNLSSSYSQDLSGYTNLVLDNFTQYRGSDTQEGMINNLPAKIVRMEENIDGLDIYFAMAVIEGKENFYQVMTWTLAEKKYQYQEKMQDILYSFNEF